MNDPRGGILAVFAAASILLTGAARAQEVKHYRFAYDQPKTTGYGILGDIFADKLKALRPLDRFLLARRVFFGLAQRLSRGFRLCGTQSLYLCDAQRQTVLGVAVIAGLG